MVTMKKHGLKVCLISFMLLFLGCFPSIGWCDTIVKNENVSVNSIFNSPIEHIEHGMVSQGVNEDGPQCLIINKLDEWQYEFNRIANFASSVNMNEIQMLKIPNTKQCYVFNGSKYSSILKRMVTRYDVLIETNSGKIFEVYVQSSNPLECGAILNTLKIN